MTKNIYGCKENGQCLVVMMVSFLKVFAMHGLKQKTDVIQNIRLKQLVSFKKAQNTVASVHQSQGRHLQGNVLPDQTFAHHIVQVLSQ